jgi:hypothetical protein
MWWISIVLMIFAGIWNSVMDVLKTRYNTSIFSSWKNQTWLKPSLSWRNKWKDGDRSKGEKFFGSSTFLVWITDFWHLAKMLMLLGVAFSIVMYQPIVAWWIDWFILYCSFTIPFELFYSKVLVKK